MIISIYQMGDLKFGKTAIYPKSHSREMVELRGEPKFLKAKVAPATLHFHHLLRTSTLAEKAAAPNYMTAAPGSARRQWKGLQMKNQVTQVRAYTAPL